MAEIVLFSPPYVRTYGKLDIKRLNYSAPPLGLAYITSYLEANGCEVRLVDLQHSTSNVKEIIAEESPKFVGISCTVSTISEARKISRIAKDINSRIKVVWGGAYPSTLPEEAASLENVDIVVYGEGELTMLELLDKGSPDGIRGTAYKEGKDVIVNPPRPLIEDLDCLPFPAFDQLRVEKYGTPFLGKGLSLVAGRGCPHNCTFCSANIVAGRQYRTRSPKNFVDELNELHDKYNVSSFTFYDDTFTIDESNVIKICNEIRGRNFRINWNCYSRVDTVSRELLEAMKMAGCKTIFFGIESGEQRMLDLTRKGITIQQVRDAITTTKKVGIKAYGAFIIGLPFDDDESIQKTIELAKGLPLDYAQFNLLIPPPGTEVWDLAQRGEGIRLLATDWGEFGLYREPIIELPTVSKEKLKGYVRKAYKEFYFRPRYIFNTLIKSSPLELWRNFKGASSLFRLVTR
jgi:radical SAM superfamily enzyme YgiQ (UPF0313 family)